MEKLCFQVQTIIPPNLQDKFPASRCLVTGQLISTTITTCYSSCLLIQRDTRAVWKAWNIALQNLLTYLSNTLA